MVRETKAQKEKRERNHMDNLDGVSSQYRSAAGLEQRSSGLQEPTDFSDPDNLPTIDKPYEPEDGYGAGETEGEVDQPRGIEVLEGNEPLPVGYETKPETYAGEVQHTS